ncbi:7-carboxy-7-deazaguanine synthase QueE [Sinorhizobium psoraleae]|uniref:7-carboxy-7-deazaguanine synthase n=1 Tax=Sinorhizobium psoraleae TaxID=520838 RepID=A0ABT4KNM9_9HYPH|nr:7-carboxy-7-deazaguanine synthase QueE [Sinorhizobium psoraleae]MCZ4093562.1 7-carboxy-7-deazaguanine synthase QueE [Sinorhizobium psoraleae]
MRVNRQAPEKRTTLVQLGHEKLDVHSIFYTIQGEGPFCGTPAVFVRLAGCNLQCPACDTDYTSGRRWMGADEICDEIQRVYRDSLPVSSNIDERVDGTTDNFPIKRFTGLVVITGGEPLRQQIDVLVFKLIQRFGCYVQVETNGLLPPPPLSFINKNTADCEGLYIVCSPKSAKINPVTAELACCFKYVIAAHSVDENDGLPVYALDNSLGKLRVARPPVNYTGTISLQPMDEQNLQLNERHLQACVQSCMQHGYRLQLQIHKILRME